MSRKMKLTCPWSLLRMEGFFKQAFVPGQRLDKQDVVFDHAETS
jgi:hypothetical protein